MGQTLSGARSCVHLGLALSLCALLQPGSLGAAEIPVRYPEGSVQGFLVLRTQEGQSLAQGVVVTAVHGKEIRRRTSFQFRDGSTLEEVVAFSQEGVYTLRSYRLDRRGPAFPENMRVSLERSSGAYRVETQDRGGGPVKVIQGALELPADTYNGMLFTVVKDLPSGESATVHLVAFMPEPKVIELEMVPAGEEPVALGPASRSAAHVRLIPRLGLWTGLLATVFGRTPEDGHVWIIEGEVPAFVGFQGQMSPGDPVWRVDLVSPVRPR